MKVKVDATAPEWANRMARSIDAAIDDSIWPFLSRQTFTVAQLTGTPGATLAAASPWRFAFVSNGAGNKYVAVSNGTAFYYLEGSAV